MSKRIFYNTAALIAAQAGPPSQEYKEYYAQSPGYDTELPVPPNRPKELEDVWYEDIEDLPPELQATAKAFDTLWESYLFRKKQAALSREREVQEQWMLDFVLSCYSAAKGAIDSAVLEMVLEEAGKKLSQAVG